MLQSCSTSEKHREGNITYSRFSLFPCYGRSRNFKHLKHKDNLNIGHNNSMHTTPGVAVCDVCQHLMCWACRETAVQIGGPCAGCGAAVVCVDCMLQVQARGFFAGRPASGRPGSLAPPPPPPLPFFFVEMESLQPC